LHSRQDWRRCRLRFNPAGSIPAAGCGSTVMAAWAVSPPPSMYWARMMTSVRQAIASRIHAHLDGATASIAEALITGERAEIPRAANRSLQASGLFHVLSISGLHMWLVAGSVFWTLRAALALSPTLALRYPIKKWAAAVALCCALFYLLLADSGVATMRSFIMIAVVFFAMLVERPAVSMRNLAIAALIVILMQPEAAVDAGFQMSFLAVLGLVTFHDVWSRRRPVQDEVVRAWPRRLVRHAAAAVMLALVTTAIAGTMSSIPATYHFGRLAPYSLVANGLAFPVIGLVVMPMALVATLLMPFGLELLPLLAMGQGLDLVLAISDLVADLPQAQMTVPQSPPVAAIALALGCTAFCLLAGPVRIAGLGVAGLGLLLALAGRPLPDVLVDGTAGNVALRNSEGLLVPAVPRKSRFSVERWLQSDGDSASPGEAVKRIGWTCLATRCEAVVKGRRIAYVTGDGTVPIACAGFDIMIASFPLRGACRAVPIRIDRFNVWRSGPHALYIDGRDVRILTARGLQGDRPWRIIPLARARPFE
jgi:competence protein ComEC